MENSKKLALVTCYFQLNYGSQLQAYATQLLFNKMGVENETICIDGIQNEINKAKYRYFLSRIWDIHTVKDKWATVKKALAERTKGREYKRNIAMRRKMFYDFSHTMFRISKRYNSKVEITAEAHKLWWICGR